MDKIQAGRVFTLANFLKTQVPQKNFDIDSITSADTRKEAKTLALKDCGTTGCGLGYCPVVFPKHWSYDSSACLCFDGEEFGFDDIESFFGLTKNAQDRTFYNLGRKTPELLANALIREARKFGWEMAD